MNDTGPLILSSDDVLRLADMGLAIAAVEDAFKARAAGKFVAPPRHSVSFDGFGDLVFTTGGSTGDPALAGFRVRSNFSSDETIDDQIVAVWNMASARLEGLLFGQHVGSIRTGAIGGVAIKHMARSDAAIAAVIGTGRQAATQIEAAAQVRDLREIRVFSRSANKRTAFAETVESRTGVTTLPAKSAEAAVAEADIVILATTSKTPVIEKDWLKAGVHINTLGPKRKNGAETNVELAEQAGLIATDSPEQIADFASPFLLTDTPVLERMIDIADIIAGKAPERTDPDAISIFYSVGLAGTEVMVAAAILAAAKRE
jgi:ornithine cyclodeaminase/alanine dehydrogenase-like protein (mu-crystallin family)